ncbi:DUF5682 family protein [Winogradskya humida]|uniref:Uncharacterized protein n=1 Tax=Winogradskya humida TaxID=113566 RepID=A0ABQ3ZPP2_9ACTN|nr:DUF5682 family protein [Actinoplanes humidus]GIE20468.1 hypothetical protein Ahu01nite_035700 [Actinoplanes humidus]
MPEHHYGIRHHGPGSARAVVTELDRQQPTILLIEGPPEADDLIRWAADPALQPPVALLGYATDDPRRSAFWPFAIFSPEWQALRWAVTNGIPVRFFDLPYAYRLTNTPAAPALPPTAAPDHSPTDGPATDSPPTDNSPAPGPAPVSAAAVSAAVDPAAVDPAAAVGPAAVTSAAADPLAAASSVVGPAAVTSAAADPAGVTSVVEPAAVTSAAADPLAAASSVVGPTAVTSAAISSADGPNADGLSADGQFASEPLAGWLSAAGPSIGTASPGGSSTGKPSSSGSSPDGSSADAPSPDGFSADAPSPDGSSAGELSPSGSSAGKPSGGKPSAGEPSGGEPSGGEPSGGEPSGGEPSGGEPSAAKPSGGEPSGDVGVTASWQSACSVTVLPSAVAAPTTVREVTFPPSDVDGEAPLERAGRVRPVDPIGELAAAAGYDDPERWWEDVVEHRGMPAFVAIAEAMAAIREASPEDPEDLVREAYMRTVLREVRRTHENVAVVCGAWHVPALSRKVSAKDDAALLKGRKKVKVSFTWVPWTYGRLASWSGYGAGVQSPGWYHHLFTTADEVVPRWLVDAAGVLRAEGVPTSSAHVIEATRLAEALATVRGRPLAGLAEVTEAAEAVMCDGEPLRVELIGRRMVVGERLGGVPADMPTVPLAKDLAVQQRAVRLKPEALERVLELDLRKDLDLGRSRLLHRMRAIGVPWGEAEAARRGTGTFREQWRLRWLPDFEVQLVEGSMHGTTVAGAATAKVTGAAREAATLGEVTALVEVCLLAELGDAFPAVLAALDTRAALDADLNHLMAAIPALARTLRYGDVRRTDVAGLETVTASLLTRVCVGLPAASGSLSDDAAKELRGHIDGVHQAVGLLDDDATREQWLNALTSVAGRSDLHGLLAGRLSRLLLDAGRVDGAEVRRRLGLSLTIGTPPAHGAAWVEGFLSGGGLLLVHDEALLELLDQWLADIPADAFDDVLPLLRRTFGAFATGERRAIGERIAGGASRAGGEPLMLDHERAARVLPTLRALLGREVG